MVASTHRLPLVRLHRRLGGVVFDCLDQRLFSLARIPALSSLMGMPGTAPEVQAFGKVVTAWFLIGWGVGGLIFGALGDRYGRARMLHPHRPYLLGLHGPELLQPQQN